jgi:ribosomal protein S18 acetylase RimI-like enzyme
VNEGLSIRKAELRDFDAVRGLAEALAAHIEEPPPPLTLERYLEFYVRDHAPLNLFLALRDDRVVGMIAWILTHELYSANAGLYISDIAVHADARGEGVGTALMAQAKAWGRAHGVAKLGWDVWKNNTTAMKFYQRLGAVVDTEAVPHLLKLANG